MSCDKGTCAAKECPKECPKDCKIKVVYFDGRGRAEGIRWILTFAKVPFQDERLTFEQWGANKDQSPIKQLPMIECTRDGKTQKMVQSFAIARTLACMNNLAGKTPCEHAACDEVVECMRDFAEAGVQAHFEKDEKRKEEMMAKLKTETGPRIFGYLEKRITDNGAKFLVGDAYTYADILVANLIDGIKLNKPEADFNAIAEKYPNLFAMAKAVVETPEIKAWIAKRPASQF